MSIEIRPLGISCNIQCRYCYQQPQRDAANIAKHYDLTKIKRSLDEEKSGSVTIFGGEPLLVPLKDLEQLAIWSFEKTGRWGIQTNGVLLNDAHIELMKKYNGNAGVSIDGPSLLNDARWAGSIRSTRESTRKTEAAIMKLLANNISVSVIVTLHEYNCSPTRLGILCNWLKELERAGIRHARLHPLEVEAGEEGKDYILSTERTLEVFSEMMQFASRELSKLKIDIKHDMESLLSGTKGATTCVWNACDPLTTRAVRGIEGNGQRSNCGRTNKQGIDFIKADTEGFERYVALYNSPQEDGGCQGCRFFVACKGQCPGTALEGDWRNRTRDCKLYFNLFEQIEGKLLEENKEPVSLRKDLPAIEHHLLQGWMNGRNLTITDALKVMN